MQYPTCHSYSACRVLRALTGISSVSNGKSLPSTCRSGLALSAGFVSPTGFILRCSEDNKHLKKKHGGVAKLHVFKPCGWEACAAPEALNWIHEIANMTKMDFNKQHVHENPNDKIDKETRQWMKTDMADHGRNMQKIRMITDSINISINIYIYICYMYIY